MFSPIKNVLHASECQGDYPFNLTRMQVKLVNQFAGFGFDDFKLKKKIFRQKLHFKGDTEVYKIFLMHTIQEKLYWKTLDIKKYIFNITAFLIKVRPGCVV